MKSLPEGITIKKEMFFWFNSEPNPTLILDYAIASPSIW